MNINPIDFNKRIERILRLTMRNYKGCALADGIRRTIRDDILDYHDNHNPNIYVDMDFVAALIEACLRYSAISTQILDGYKYKKRRPQITANRAAAELNRGLSHDNS